VAAEQYQTAEPHTGFAIVTTRVYNCGKEAILKGLDLSSSTIKVALVMTNTTCDTENDGISVVGDFTTLDEHNGSGYARQTLSGKTVTKQDANDRAKFSATDPVFASLGAGSRNVAGVLLIWDNGGTLVPISFHEYTTPRVADGTDFEVPIRADTGLILGN